MDTLHQDLRYALRTLLRSRGFTAAAVLCLGLGIGLNTVVFATLNALFLRPLPFEEPHRLVAVQEHWIERGGLDDDISYPNFVSWTADPTVFASAAAYFDASFNLSADEQPEYVPGAVASPELFRTLGVEPSLGRGLLPEEATAGQDAVVVISDRLWERLFQRERASVGRVILLNGRPRTVVGVMPDGFHFPEEADLWVPLALDPQADRGNHFLQGIARLAPGMSLEAAQAAVEPIAAQLQETHPETNARLGVALRPVRENLIQGEVRTVLLIMLAAVGFVLLIACANVAGLLLARAMTRAREVSIRAALGAGRARMVRQFLTESLLLALCGGAVGAVLGAWGLAALEASVPVQLPYWMRLDLDSAVLAWLAGAVLLTALFFGTAPALRAARADLQGVLREGGPGGPSGPGRQRLRTALTAGQLAVSVVLLVGAGLMVRSSLSLGRVETGFRTENLLTMRVLLTGERYRDADARAAYLQQALGRIDALPGAVRSAAVSDVPLSGGRSNTSISVGGHAFEPGRAPSAGYRTVTEGYFETMGIPLVAGRSFRPEEVRDGGPVVVVSQTLVERFWPGESGVGKRIARGQGDDVEWLEVVGVVPAVRQDDLADTPRLQVYFPYRRAPFGSMALVVRAQRDAMALAPAVRDRLRALDPTLAQFQIQTMEQIIDLSFWDRRLYGSLFAVFAVAAMLLAAIGVYGVMAFAVEQRRGEFGIRMALGARASDVLGLALRSGLVLTGGAVALGLAGALLVSRVLEGFLHGVRADDPATFLSSAVVLGGAALLASWLPARRALKVTPAEALRRE